MKPCEKLCIALDFSTRAQVVSAAHRFGPKVGWLKIGLEAFVAGGPSLVSEIAAAGKVFLDLKFHDIPNTVARSVAAAARFGVSMVNVHGLGGREMLVAARQALAGESRPKLVAVTLLTSLDARALADLPMAGHPEGISRRLALLAQECGLDGVVCSASDLLAVRGACRPDFFTVVPGIRPAGCDLEDQRRVAFARVALDAGADLLVVGRPVTGAADPDQALEQLIAEMESSSK